MKTLLKLLMALLMLAPSCLRAAATDGTATFNVLVAQYNGSYDPKHVNAIWVTTSSGTFVKTLRKDGSGFTGEGTGKLYKFNAARGSSTVIDGFSGATISTYNPLVITWNCRDLSNNIVPDGDYLFYVETTSSNAQGPWTTNGIVWTKSSVAFSNSYPDQPYIRSMSVVFTPAAAPHDITVLAVTPAFAQPNSSVTMTVAVTNKTVTAETITVSLTNTTTGNVIGTRAGIALAANARTNVTFTWDTTGLSLGTYAMVAGATIATNETYTTDNLMNTTVVLRDPTHDVGVNLVSLPVMMAPNATSNIVLAVQNNGDFAESFAVRIFDETDNRQISSNYVNSLAKLSATNLTVVWAAGAASLGFHTLRVTAGPVAGEPVEQQLNNTQRVSVAVANGTTAVTLVATNAVWRYNDTGMDLTGTPWTDVNYFDATWNAGAAPLGYAANTYTNYFLTLVGYGTNASSKHITTYFRNAFPVNFTPISATLNLKCDDGAVIYLNGRELQRLYMGSGDVTAASLATNTVGAINVITNISFSVPSEYFVAGLNELSVEIHQAATNSSDIMLGLELTATIPSLPVVHNVAVTKLAPAGEALAGEVMPVGILLTNRGNVTETFTVYLVNTNNNQILASKVITNLPAGGTASVDFNWKTPTTATGSYGLSAYTVVGTTTNLAGIASAAITIPGSGAGLNLVNAAGSLGGRCSALAADGTRLLVGAGATLVLMDITNPAAPVRTGSLRLPGIIEGIAVSGTNVFVACGSAGVQLVSLANPAQPVHLASFETAGHAYNVRLSGTTLAVAAGKAGLMLLNVANPAAPALLGSYVTEGPAKAVYVNGVVCYLLDQHLGLLVLNLANPANPVLMGSYKFNGGLDLAISGSKGFTIDAGGKLQVISLLSPTAPALSYALQLNGAFCQKLAVSGTTVYVAAENAGILTVNAASVPVATATNLASDSIIAALAYNSTLYAADSFAGLQIFNILNNPLAPALLGSVPLGFRASDAVIADGRAYVAAGEAGLRIFSVADAANPVLLGAYTGSANARSVALAGGKVFLGEGEGGFKIVNVNDPGNPTLAGAFSSTNIGSVRAIAATATKAVLTDGAQVMLFDVTAPASPLLLATYPVPGFGLGLTLSGDTAILAAGSAGVVLLDFSGGTLSQTSIYDTPGIASGVAVISNRVQVADGPAGWLVLDISNPSAPALVSSSTTQGPVNAIGAADNLAWLSGGAGPLAVLDVSTPLTPVPQASLGPLVSALKLSGAGQLAVAAEGEAGLTILSAGEADNDHDAVPDEWEQQIVNASKATNGPISTIAQVNPNDDFDGDGLSNRQEFIAGTSPVDPQSVFAVQAAAGAAPSLNVVRWHSVAGKSYTLYQSANLASGFTVLQADIPATPPMNSFTNTTATSATFYIISVK